MALLAVLCSYAQVNHVVISQVYGGGRASVKISDASGSQVGRNEVQLTQAVPAKIDLSGLENGVYFIHISIAGTESTLRMVVNK
jgi:hypothetical protein